MWARIADCADENAASVPTDGEEENRMSAIRDTERIGRGLARVEHAVGSRNLSEGAAQNVRKWLTEPNYARYANGILEIIERGDFPTLDTLFWEVIPFGTGGRRGQMAEFGSATINERTIGESAQGLAAYLHQFTGKAGGKAVIAHDSRHRSSEFARLAASVLAANGLHVYFFDSHRSTPELSFAVRHLQCDVGAMISASHNPPADNGFKAYWSTGAQVLSPHDKGIIDCVYRTGEIPQIEFDAAVAAGKIERIGDEVDRAYIAAVRKMSLSAAREMPAVFTPLHGVGETSVYRILREAGFDGVRIFEPQRAPDGGFPNVPDHLPNPERVAVFGPAVQEALATGAELVLASDPDADRLGASVKGADGTFVHLTGNRIAVLLTDYVLRKRAAAGTLTSAHYVVETLVTTPLVGAIARAHHVHTIDDLLVGFKYIAQTMDREGAEKFVFGAEESLGYLAGNYARDKDAGIAALYLMELAAELRQAGKTLLDRLDELFAEHGYYLEDQRSETCHGPRGKEQIERLMRQFREKPPEQLSGVRLARVRDYGRQEIRGLPENRRIAELPEPRSDLVFFESEAGPAQFLFAVRPSGTEPKIKFYFFARTQRPAPGALATTKSEMDAALKGFMDGLTAWIQGVLSQS